MADGVKGIFAEFKEFISKGNVMSMAVGVMIGAAFQGIVTSLTTSFITPLIAAVTGGIGEDGKVQLGGEFVINGAKFTYGAFASAVINFLIMAVILFFLVKAFNALMSRLQSKKDAEPAPAPEPSNEEKLLTEIRDLLKAQRK